MFINGEKRPFQCCPFQLTQSIYNQISIMIWYCAYQTSKQLSALATWVIFHYCAWHRNSFAWLMTFFLLPFLCLCKRIKIQFISTNTYGNWYVIGKARKKNQWRFIIKFFLMSGDTSLKIWYLDNFSLHSTQLELHTNETA